MAALMQRFLWPAVGAWMAALAAPAAAQTPAAPFQSAIRAADVDVAASKLWRDGKAEPVDADQLLGLLGLAPEAKAWGRQIEPRDQYTATLRYMIALKRPVEVGSFFFQGTPGEVRYLKPGGKLPADPANESSWAALPLPPRQSGAHLAALPPGTKTVAFLLREQRASGRSSLSSLRLLKHRLHNVTPHGLAYAKEEYTPPMSQMTFSASRITRGEGEWVNTGKDNEGLLTSPQISDINPMWFILAWRSPQAVRGLWLDDNFEQLELDAFVGDEGINPRVGTPQEWRRIKTFEQTLGQGRWIALPPLQTRAIRFRILNTSPAPIATITGLHAVVELGEQPVPPAPAAEEEDPLPPKRFTLKLEHDRNVTLAIDGPNGTRARNLVTREALGAGSHELAWDLKDESGSYVAPGTYRWKAAVYEPFGLRYETTVYPNVLMHAPENSPWLNGHDGPGGWLADHTPPIGVCTAGDRVYLSAYVAESGVSLIECDLAGRKLWGHHSFAAWTGPRFLASDGRTVFVGATVLNTTEDAVWGVDIASKEVRQVLSLHPTASRKRGLQGLAAHNDQVALSVQATDDWLANAAAAEDVDPEASIPRYGPKRKPRKAYELVPDRRTDFLRLFRLIPNPSGGETSYTLTYLESMTSASPRQHIVLAFCKPVPIGSVVLPVPQGQACRVRLSVLKPQAPFPPDPEEPAYWQPFATQGAEPWDVAIAPEGTMTRALRITFDKSGQDEADPLAALLDGGGKPADPLQPDLPGAGDDKKKLVDFGADSTRWQGQLEGMKLLRRRFSAPQEKPEIRVNSGEINSLGEWDALRQRPLSEQDPGIYVMEWQQPQKLRGLAIKEIDGQLTRIDVYRGPAAGKIDIQASDGWEEVAQYEQGRRDVGNGYGGLGLMNPTARYVDGYVDFGKEIETRAVRLRVVKQWADNGQAACLGVRIDHGGRELDARRCRVYGVVALSYVGGEPPVDAGVSERVELYNAADGKLVKEVPLAKPRQIAFDADGRLLAISDSRVVEVNWEGGGQHRTLIDDLEEPTDLAVDADGNIFAFDAGSKRQNVRVYDHEGTFVRSIGTPGGLRAGAWDPTRMGTVTAIDVDRQGQLWVVENQYWPKRITVWTAEGRFVKELLGNTAYGGGGVLDPVDTSRVFYGPLEFELDWKTGHSRLKNLTTLDGFEAGEVPLRVAGHTYMVTRPLFSERPVGRVYLYEQDHLKPAAAVGLAIEFGPLKKPEVLAALGDPDLTKFRFIWTDRSGDGQVQPEEVELLPRPPHVYGVTNFNRDLSVQQQSFRYIVKEFLPSGVPVYESREMPTLKSRTLYRLDEGNFFRMGDSRQVPEAVLTPEGKPLWSYPSEGSGVQGPGTFGPWTPGQVVSQFGIVGHETAHAGDLGEFVVIHGNFGAWNVWTTDGLLVGPIFRDLRLPRTRTWSMPAHERGMSLDGVTAGQEHFAGYFCKTSDNKYYAVAGHNHVSLVEVLGLDRVRRLEGQITITPDDLRKAQAWEQRRQVAEVYSRAPVVDCYRVPEPPRIDGDLKDWKGPDAQFSAGQGTAAALRIGYDDHFLYLAYQARGLGPLRNAGQQFDRLFKTGGSVDLQLGLDPEADDAREAPTEGDLRLLLTYVGESPRAVLYRAVVPGTDPKQVWRVVSPVSEVTFDQVKQLDDVSMAYQEDGDRWALEAAVPLKTLGLVPAENLRLKMDWGVLTTDESGNQVLQRLYWANKATSVVADAPSEARLNPNLWGHVRFGGQRPSTEDRLTGFDPTAAPKAGARLKKDIDDILQDLKDEK